MLHTCPDQRLDIVWSARVIFMCMKYDCIAQEGGLTIINKSTKSDCFVLFFFGVHYFCVRFNLCISKKIFHTINNNKICQFVCGHSTYCHKKQSRNIKTTRRKIEIDFGIYTLTHTHSFGAIINCNRFSWQRIDISICLCVKWTLPPSRFRIFSAQRRNRCHILEVFRDWPV